VEIENKLYCGKLIKFEFENITSTFLKTSFHSLFNDTGNGHITNNDNCTLNTELSIMNVIPLESELYNEPFMLMFNKIDFKGNLKHPFYNSTKAEFSAMELTENLKVTFIPELESDVLELPYQNEEISMIIVLPSNTTGVNFINILCTAFALIDPESVKNTVKSSVSFYAFGIYKRKSCS